MGRMTARDRRDQILAAAIGLFAENGFRGTTTKQLAAGAGITEPVLYRHFKTKGDLYAAIIEQKAQEGLSQAAKQLGPYLGGDDDEGFLTALAELIVDCYHQDPAYVRLLLFSALERHELSDLFFERHVLAFYQMVGGYLRRRMREGAIRQLDPNLAARLFLGMIHHHSLVGALFGEKIVRASRKTFVRELVQTFLGGVASNRGDGRARAESYHDELDSGALPASPLLDRLFEAGDRGGQHRG